MTSRPHRAWLALLGLCVAACGPSRGGPTTPPTTGPVAPTSAPVPTRDEPRPEDREMIAIGAFSGQLCSLARSGALYCWGSAMVPGEKRRQPTPRPRRLPSVPALAGFEMVDDGIVGWDEQGNAIVISNDHGGFSLHQGVHLTERVSSGAWISKLRRVRVKAASRRCLLTDAGQLLCNGPANAGTHYRDRFPGEYSALGTGRFACAVDAEGRAVAINASEYALEPAITGNVMAPYEIRPIAGLPRHPTSLACNYGSLGKSKEMRPYACAVDGEQRLSCTDPGLEKELVRLAEGVPIRSVIAHEHFCVQRDDGQARCVATSYYPHAEQLASLVGLDASRGLALDSGSICALGEDGTPRCWGQQRVPQLGDGSTIELEAPVHVEGFDGALEVSHCGGITCVRHSPERVRCFGRYGSTVIEPRELRLPEPVDRIEGGDPLCVRGAKSQSWYCRDQLRSFFGGSLPDHFTPLVDTRGKKLGKHVTSLALDLGVGIKVSLDDGRTGAFSYSGVRKPLRVELVKGKAEPMRQLVRGGGIRADGRGVFELPNRLFVTRGPVEATATVLERPCFLDDAHQLSCFDAKLERAEVIARDVASLDPLGGALTTDGRVLAFEIVDERVTAKEREGLPPMAQLAGPCGRSVAGEIWCWGTVEHLPGPAHRLEPKPVELMP